MSVQIKVGCCGFPVARNRYYQTFSLVEVQQTFYQPPEPATARRWRTEAPPGFEFALKAWQLITHEPSSPTYRRLKENIPQEKRDSYGSFRPTTEVLDAWERIKEMADILQARVVVFQSPASFGPTPEHKENLRRFFSSIQRKRLLLAWEPRGRWNEAELLDLCRELELIHCVDPFKNKPLYGEINYFRLHGRTGYRYRYTENDLNELKDKCASRPLSYCLFNNVPMFEDARRYQELTTF